jgi:hypothetical protein
MSDDLEVGIAAGLDVPTAIVTSQDDKPPQPQGCLTVIFVVAIVWLFVKIAVA